MHPIIQCKRSCGKSAYISHAINRPESVLSVYVLLSCFFLQEEQTTVSEEKIRATEIRLAALSLTWESYQWGTRSLCDITKGTAAVFFRADVLGANKMK